MADAPSLFRNERVALVRDLRGSETAAAALDQLVAAYLRGDRSGRVFHNPLMSCPEIEETLLRRSLNGRREKIARARRTVEAVRRAFEDVHASWASSSNLVSIDLKSVRTAADALGKTLDELDGLLPRPMRGRPKPLIGLQRWWLCSAAIVTLRSHGLNFRPARSGSRLQRVLERVCRAAHVPAPNDMYSVMREAVAYGDAWIEAAARRAAQPRDWPVMKAIVRNGQTRGYVIEPEIARVRRAPSKRKQSG